MAAALESDTVQAWSSPGLLLSNLESGSPSVTEVPLASEQLKGIFPSFGTMLSPSSVRLSTPSSMERLAPAGQCRAAFDKLDETISFFVPSPKMSVSAPVGFMSTGCALLILTFSMRMKALAPAGMTRLVDVGLAR
jgi:hypothetical protein